MANYVDSSGFRLASNGQTYGVEDDFTMDQTDLVWIDTVTDTGTALSGDAAAGIMTITPSDGTVADNDEVYLATANENFLFAAGKPIYAKTRMKFAEGATNKANVMVGFQSAVAADSLVDDGAGPRATGSGMGIYKVDGGTKWYVWSIVNGTTTATLSSLTAGSSSYVIYEFFLHDHDTTNGWFTVKANGDFLKDSNGNVIRHAVPYASATEMQFMFGLKNGQATTVESVLIDYVVALQTR